MRRWIVVLSLSVLGCGDDATSSADAGVGPTDAGSLAPWPRALPASADLGETAGLEVARTIIHLHSPLSHDACDNEGWIDGALADAQCLASLRDALCVLRIDAAMLTDHAPHVEEVPFESALWIGPEDEAIVDAAGNTVAARWRCADGHETLVTVGAENDLMPVGLDRHPLEGATAETLRAAYDADGADAVASFRDAGALVLVPHTESRDIDYLRALGMDGIEIYNVHANLAPDIRAEFLGLDGYDYIDHLLEFNDRRKPLASDLAFLAFFSENDNALGKWDTLLSAGMRVPGLAGSDAHQNVFAAPMADGERGDSYRRVLRWFSNHVLVAERTVAAIEEAVAAGRFYVAFEAFGSPVGFSFTAGDAQMGDTVPAGTPLRVTRPSLPEDHPQDPPPAIRLRILRAEPGGAVEVAAGDAETLEHTPTTPGAYRAEVHILPAHAAPYLDRLATPLVRDHLWLYANPIYVE